MRAGTGYDKEDLMEEKINLRLKRRQELIRKIMIDKRIPNAHQKEQKKIHDFFSPEVKEAQLEDPVEKGKLDLSRHRKKSKKSGKRCWMCYSPHHLKRFCPYNKCFFCGKLGHVKADCWKRKINYIYQRLWEELRLKEQRRKNKIKENKDQKKQKELEKKIFIQRSKKLNVELVKTEKGDVSKAKWNGKIIGDYLGVVPLNPIIESFRHDRYDWSLINLLVGKAIPYHEVPLYKGLTNWCGCGTIDLNSKDLICHVKEHHHGVIQKNSQLNRPPWLDLIKYLTEEIEEGFFFTEESLDDLIE